MKSIKKLYLIVLAGTLIPFWVGNWFLANTKTDLISDPFALFACSLYALACWGTSIGFFYLGKVKYGIISGLGKLLLIGSGIGAYYLSGSIGHPYLIFIGIAFAILWGMFDFIFLFITLKNVNKQVKDLQLET